MSAQFKKDDEVRCVNADGSGGELTAGAIYTVTAAKDYGPLGHQVLVNAAAHNLWWREDRFEKVEPKDKTDAYVEPEPLREGDWVQVWARVDALQETTACVEFPGNAAVSPLDAVVPLSAIARTDDTPPWVKPERCTSLKARTDSEGETVFLRCHLVGHHVDHGSKFLGGRYDWTTAEEHGRITEGGAS